MMYGKIFESMYEGTLYGQWEAIVTMQQFIVLATADGVVDMTPMVISAKTSIPRAIIDKGIEILSKPDPYSRTPGNDGIRIRLIDDHKPWGWYIVNHEKYNLMVKREDKREADRIRIAEKRKVLKNKDLVKVSQSVANVANVAYVEEDVDVYEDGLKTLGHSVTASFESWWSGYPRKVKKKTALEIWKRKKPDADLLIADVKNRLANDAQWMDGYIPHPTTYLNQERWNDELACKKEIRKLTYAEQLAADLEKSNAD